MAFTPQGNTASQMSAVNITLTELGNQNEGIPHCPRLKHQGWGKKPNWAKARSSEQYIQDYAEISSELENSTRTITGYVSFHCKATTIPNVCGDWPYYATFTSYFFLVSSMVFQSFWTWVPQAWFRYFSWGRAYRKGWWETKEKEAEREFNEAKIALDADELLLQNFKKTERCWHVEGLATNPCLMSSCALASSIPEEVFIYLGWGEYKRCQVDQVYKMRDGTGKGVVSCLLCRNWTRRHEQSKI